MLPIEEGLIDKAVETLPHVVEQLVEVQACVDLVTRTMAQVAFPLVGLAMTFLAAVFIIVWPRRKQVSMIVTKNAEGEVVDVAMVRYHLRHLRAQKSTTVPPANAV